MPDRIPISVNPEHAATRGFKTSGKLKLETMERLLDRLLPPYGEVTVELGFGKNGRKMFLQGNIVGEAVLQCQRCLKDMNLEINHQFRLSFVSTEAEIDELLPGEEPLMLNGDPSTGSFNKKDELRLADVIEDELELLLPMVIKHSSDVGEDICQNDILSTHENSIDRNIEQNEVKPSKKNPFAVLKDLKKH